MATAVYKRVRRLNVEESAYIAGIIDGEGSITLDTKQKGGNKHLALHVSNTDRVLLEYLQKIIGAGKIITKRTYKPHHKPAYAYSIHNRQALAVLEQIVLYLRTYKLRRAKIALARYILVTPRNGKYDDILHKKREMFVQQFLSIVQ